MAGVFLFTLFGVFCRNQNPRHKQVFEESFLVYIGNVRIKLLFGIKAELPVLSKLIP